jgi:hypothetical protein
MAEPRIKIGLQTELSTSPHSLVKTNASNEQEYFPLGINNQVLFITGGVPTWINANFDLTDGTNTQSVFIGNTLSVLGGNGITSLVSATDTVTLTAKISTDTDNAVVFGTDFGLYVPKFLTISGNVGTNDKVNLGEVFTFTGVGGLRSTILDNQVSYELRTQEDVFTGLTSGLTVTLSQTPLKVLGVYRNGLNQLLGAGLDYTITGTTVTFNTSFSVSGGGSGSETVRVLYTY